MQDSRACVMAFALCIAVLVHHSPSAGEESTAECKVPETIDTAGHSEHSTDSTLFVLSLPTGVISVDQWLRENGWKVQRGNVEQYRIEDGALIMKNIDASTVIGKELDPAIDPEEFPLIEFKVLVEEIPAGTDVTTRSMDDAAFRLFVLFDKGGGLLSPPETIGYVWDSTMKSGETGRSGMFGQIRYIVIGSGKHGLGEWQGYERNLVDDYRALFDSDDIPPISAIALKCDSNHSHAAAVSRIRWIRLRAPGGDAP